jgi:predicted protein tyrosine phosphatase
MKTHRGRAWRRSQRARILSARCGTKCSPWSRSSRKSAGHFAKQHGWPWYVSPWARVTEKKWRHLYLRSVKLRRARKLGQPYPRRSWGLVTRAEHDGRARAQLKVLFVCSKNQWRSPTAERMWRRDARFAVRSAGTSGSAARVITWDDIAWADVIFAMEEKHKQRVLSVHGQLEPKPNIVVLDIPDEYKLMSPELVELLSEQVTPLLDALLRQKK